MPFLWFGWDWATPGMWFVFASALMLLPRRLAAAVVTVGLAGYEVAEFNAARAASYAYPQVVLFMVYYLAIFVMGAAALYGSVRLVGILDDLFTARTDLAEQALARERFRVSRDLHDLLGQSLSAVSLKGDLAIALLPSDPAAAQREIESLTSVARSALHGMRAVARDEHDVSLRAETDSAAAVLAAAGINVPASRPGCQACRPPSTRCWPGRSARVRPTSCATARPASCSITGRREDGRVRLEIVNDGARAAGNPGTGTGLAGLAEPGPRAAGIGHGGVPRRRRVPAAGRAAGGGAVIRVLIAEDMHMIRGALVALLSLEDGIEVVAELDRGDQIVAAALRTHPDVAVLDIDLPGLDGLTAAEQLYEQVPGLPHADPDRAQPARQPAAGAESARPRLHRQGRARREARRRDPPGRAGERVVDPDLVAAALETGSSPLTPREADVLRAAAEGISTEQIGTRLHLSPTTVRNYLSNAIAKVGGRNRIDAIRIARNAGWI